MPPTCSHQPVEVYSKLFYKEKVQPLVKTEIEERGIKKEDRLNIVKKLTQDAFNMELEEVRQEIFAQAVALKAESAKHKAQARKAEPDTSPEAYAAAIESVPDILDVFFRDLALRTGWAFSVLCGGPDPANGGRIQTISFHEGKNFLGASFKKSHISFEQSVLKPYVEFLGQVYTPGECTARALPESADVCQQCDLQPDPQPLPIAPLVTDMLSPHAPSAPAASTMGGSGIPPNALALIDSTLHPATSPSAVSAANQAPASETASPNLTTDLHAPPVPLVNTTALMDIPPFTSPTANGQPFIFPSMISFAPQDSIGTALHIPLPLVPVVLSPIPASPLLPVPPQGPFNTTPTPPVPPSVEPASVTSLLIRPAPKEKKRPAAPKKKPGKKPSVKATSTKALNVEASTTVPTLTVESIGHPNKDQQAEVPVGLQTGRGQRIRKVTVSKEVVPLTDNQHRNAKEGERAPKRRRNH